MIHIPVKHLRTALLLGTMACVATSFAFMYQAGCAGDLESGLAAPRSTAFETESTGVVLECLSLVLFAAFAAARPRLQPVQRCGVAVIALILGLIVLTPIGIQLEVWGIGSCTVTS